MEDPKFLEKASGNIGTSVAATLIAASGGAYLAPLLPTLSTALANRRYQDRVGKALSDLEDRLAAHEEQVRNLSDAQFKLVSEVTSTLLHTNSEQKIDYLKNAVINGVGAFSVEDHEVSVISRSLRDISLDEMRYLIFVVEYQEVIVVPGEDGAGEEDDKKMCLSANDPVVQLVSGLNNLGLIATTSSGYGGTINYRILPVAKELVRLVSE